MMGIGAVGSYEYGYGYGYGVGISPFGSAAAGGTASADDEKSGGIIINPGESTKVSPGRRSSPAECETCKNRKYQDGSHEQEHVSNAYRKAAQGNGKVLSATVSLRTAICPECGRSYTAGGTTSTKISYSDESNPYQQNKKSVDAAALIGQNLDVAV